MKQIFHFISVVFLLLALSACDNKMNMPIIKQFGKVESFSNSGCKRNADFFRTSKKEAEVITWEALEGGRLKIRYKNFVASCGLDKYLSAESEIEEDKLVLIVGNFYVDEAPVADCICKYDLEVVLLDFEAGKDYTIVFKNLKWVVGKANFTYSPKLSGSLVVKK